MKKIKKLLTSDVDLYFQMTWTQFSLVHCYLEYWYKSCNTERIQKPSSAVYMSRQRMEVIFFLGLSQHESQTRALWINCHGAEERLPSSWCWQNRLEGDKMVLAFGVLRRHGCLYLEKPWYLILYITTYICHSLEESWFEEDVKMSHTVCEYVSVGGKWWVINN